MKIEIDQSGKIEETHRDTILAMANGVRYIVRITAKTKRRLQDLFRCLGEPRTYVITLFTVAIYELARSALKGSNRVIIDTEYPGYERVIITILGRMVKESYPNANPIIHFGILGKRSTAHVAASNAFRKMLPVNRVLSYNYFLKKCFVIKNGYPVLKHPVSKDG